MVVLTDFLSIPKNKGTKLTPLAERSYKIVFLKCSMSMGIVMSPSINPKLLFNIDKTNAAKILDRSIEKKVNPMIINSFEIMIFFLLIGYVNIKVMVLSLYSSITNFEINTPEKTMNTIRVILSIRNKKSVLLAANCSLSIYSMKNKNPVTAKHAAKELFIYRLKFIFLISKLINLKIFLTSLPIDIENYIVGSNIPEYPHRYVTSLRSIFLIAKYEAPAPMMINTNDLTMKEPIERSDRFSLLMPKKMAMIIDVIIVVLTDFLSIPKNKGTKLIPLKERS